VEPPPDDVAASRRRKTCRDPDVIARLRQHGGHTSAGCTALYLLTVADIRGTSPKVWNAWKGKLLEDLYRLTLRALGGAQPDFDAEIEARKHEAHADLRTCARAARAPKSRCGKRWT
jgi:[protein-PII] uridylyltransferase